jgi:hypothetical protein
MAATRLNVPALRHRTHTHQGVFSLSFFPEKLEAVALIKQTPQDIMHVIFEGVAPMEIKLVLKNLILSGQIELDEINSAILNVPYSPLDI